MLVRSEDSKHLKFLILTHLIGSRLWSLFKQKRFRNMFQHFPNEIKHYNSKNQIGNFVGANIKFLFTAYFFSDDALCREVISSVQGVEQLL